MTGERWISLGAMAAALGAGAYIYLSTAPEVVPERAIVAGPAGLLERFECYRCHDAPGVFEPAHRDRSCVRCHQAVLAGELDDDYEPEALERWRQNIVHLTAVPGLTGLEQRFRRSWLVAFLREPHDLRPHLAATMPRFRMTRAEAQQIATFLIPVEQREFEAPAGDAGRGRQLFMERRCLQCHEYGGSGLLRNGPVTAAEVRLAPDLRHTRDRMSRAALLLWLADPQAIVAGTLMPRPDLDEEERADVGAFLLDTALELPVPESPPERSPVLTRPIRFAEVDARVFRRLCRHCHADAEGAGGDGGPGNTGGFGFEGRGIDFSSYDAIHRSPELFVDDGTGDPLLVAAMWRRHLEVAGRSRERRGMPLGLPPVTTEELCLVES